MKKSTTELQKTSDVRHEAIAATHLLGEGTKRALQIMSNTSYKNAMSARAFARLMWPDNPMHNKTSNTGNRNGSCKGKAGWLCGGSFLSKLKNKGLVNELSVSEGGGYYISIEGKKAVAAFA